MKTLIGIALQLPASIILSEFPIATACGHTLVAAARDGFGTSCTDEIFPRVRMETPAPPVLCEKHIGKESPAGNIPSACLLSFGI
jgi:hypothetical protein